MLRRARLACQSAVTGSAGLMLAVVSVEAVRAAATGTGACDGAGLLAVVVAMPRFRSSAMRRGAPGFRRCR